MEKMFIMINPALSRDFFNTIKEHYNYNASEETLITTLLIDYLKTKYNLHWTYSSKEYNDALSNIYKDLSKYPINLNFFMCLLENFYKRIAASFYRTEGAIIDLVPIKNTLGDIDLFYITVEKVPRVIKPIKLININQTS